MADVRPFRAYRYDLGRVGGLGDVVAPPYDVINATLQDALYAKSPFNVIRLILNREEPTDTEKQNRYTRAAHFMRDWQAAGVLHQDSARAIYAYHQDFEVEGQRYTRKGFLARVRLEPLGTGKVYAHEETLPGPRADRLQLFRATGMNLSPVFGLYPDDAGEVQAQLDAAVRNVLPLEATDHLGVVSRLWPVADQSAASAVTGLMGPRPVFIADGHHRYETGLTYREERRRAGEVRGEDAAANFILMNLVGMSDPGLVVLPTHRLAGGAAGLTAGELGEALGRAGRVEHVARGEAGARQVWERMRADGTQNVLGFGTASDQTWQMARFDCEREMADRAPQHSTAWRSLAVSVLHVVVFSRCLAGALGPNSQYRYVHLLHEAEQAVARKECAVAVLVPPATIGHVREIAGNREKMPPKSTYFYPKLLSGLLFNPLTGS
jgi:uncharacterized protein (DUF1015 family)